MTSMDEQPDPPAGNQPSPDDSRPSPGAQASPSGARFWLRIALPLVVLVVVVVATVYVVAGGSSHPATSASLPAASGTAASPGPGATPASHGPSATRTARGQAGGVQASGIPAGGLTGSAALTKLGSTALPLPNKLHATVAAWDAGRGGRALAALTTQFGIVLQAAGVKQYVPMKIACARLAGAAAAAAAGPPIPDAAMQRLYAKALADFAKGAADCRAAVSERPTGDETTQTRVNTVLLHRALSLVAAGSTDLYRATAEIEALKRH